MLEDLRLMVDKDEKILWEKKPNKLCYILEGIFNPLFPFALLWLIFDSLVAGLILFAPNSEEVPYPFTIIFFALHLMPVWIYLAGLITVGIKYRNTAYIITDKAVYVSGGVFAKTFETKLFAELSRVNIHRGVIDQILGVGDVELIGNECGYNSQAHHSTGLTICDISDYQEVYKTVKQLQTDIYSDTMFPNDLRPKENHGYKTQYKRDL